MSQLVFNWSLQKIKEKKTVIYGLFVLVKFKESNEKKTNNIKSCDNEKICTEQ